MKDEVEISANEKGILRGFTLMEMLVSFLMLVILLVALLVIFERSARIGRDQTEVAAIQQSSRIAHSELLRHARMAGAGGLPITWKSLPTSPAQYVDKDDPGAFPNGFAVAIQNDQGGGLGIPSNDSGGRHQVIPHSDVLVLRGAFSLPVYYYYPAVQTKGWDLAAPGKIGTRILEIPNRIGQDFRIPLEPLVDYLEQGRPALFIIRDLMNPDAYAVLRWVQASAANNLIVSDCTTLEKVEGVQGTFDVGCIQVAVELEPTEAYAKLNLGSSLEPNAGSITLPMPGTPRDAMAFPFQFGSIAVLQEYRYYVRVDYEVPGDPTSRLAPVLTRTEFIPSTETDPNPNDFIESIDVVDNVIDLQVAAGIDQDWSITAAGHGVVTDTGNETDEVLFNHPSDLATEPPAGLSRFDGRGIPAYIRWFHPRLDVYFLRISTLVQSPRPERDFVGNNIGTIEDCPRFVDFNIGARTFNYSKDNKYRLRLVTSVAELRNLK